MKKLLSLLLLWILSVQAATVNMLPGPVNQPVMSLSSGRTPMLTPVAGVDASDNVVPLKVNADGSLQVTGGVGGGGGDASAANQVTGNNSLSSIDGKIPALINGAQPVQINSTNFIASVANSTTAQLASGATFTGTIESIFNQQSVSVLAYSDKAGTITLNQYIDAAGTKLISSWSYSMAAGVPFSRSFTGNGNYFNMIYKNTGSSATTNLQVDVAYGTLPATTNLGNGNVAINEINGDAISNTLPNKTGNFVPVRSLPQQLFRTTFASNIASGVDSKFFTNLVTGSGMTVSQSGGNLTITSGTTANDETILRSVQTFKGNLELKWSTILSQRITNNNFFVELVDLIGDNLAYTINSTTSVTVTIPSNPFTSANVGQSLTMQQITGTVGTIPGRYAIASVSGNNVTFTVAGFPASGSGTLSLVGWNYVKAYYTGVTATNAVIETQRRGYNINASFTDTINTTASSGHIGAVVVEDSQVALLDQLQAAAATLNLTRRGEIVQSLPEENTSMYLQIHVLNGSTAPASTTTWTLGMASVASRVVQNVTLNSISPMSQNATLPVVFPTTPTVTVGSITAGTNVIGNVGVGVVSSADQVSAAITTTTTSAAKTITNGASVSFTVNATVVSGTSPTYDFCVQESNDGTIWMNIYCAPRLTAVSSLTTPALRIRGTQYRYVETISGTSPSFTRTITTARIPHAGDMVRALVDRTIAPNTASSVTPTLYTEGCDTFQLMVSSGAGATTAPVYSLQGSEDNSAFYDLTTTVTGTASTNAAAYKTGILPRYVRAQITTTGVAAVQNYVTIRCTGR